jgi:hypothetical protein
MAMAGLECWHSRSLFSKLAAAAVISILPLRLSTIVPGVFTGDTNHFQKVNTGGSRSGHQPRLKGETLVSSAIASKITRAEALE